MKPLLHIPYDAKAVFRERPNRFLGVVDIYWPEKRPGEMIHVHDPGRLPDLLLPGNKILLKKAASVKRKTAWDLIAARSPANNWVFVNSAHHRRLVESLWKEQDITPVKRIREVRAEVKWGRSRLDFELLLETGERVYVEVKGCTFARDHTALFPDAPTVRGTKHLEELIHVKETGHKAILLLLVFREEALCFSPYKEIDPGFAKVFREAVQAGVKVIVLVVGYNGKRLCIRGRIPVCS